jgi:hypothetical protein
MAAIIHSDRRMVDRRLSQYFNSTRDQWIDIVKAAVAARARCTDDFPKSAPGYYAWESATTRSRQMFCREGWEKGEENGIETIVNHDLKKKVAILNTDLWHVRPKPVAKKQNAKRPSPRSSDRSKQPIRTFQNTRDYLVQSASLFALVLVYFRRWEEGKIRNIAAKRIFFWLHCEVQRAHIHITGWGVGEGPPG